MTQFHMQVVSALNALTAVVTTTLLRPQRGEFRTRAFPSLAHADLAPEPIAGLRRPLSPEERRRARPQSAGRSGLRRHTRPALLALAAAAFLLFALGLTPPSIADDTGILPSAPQNLSSKAGDRQVTLTWDAPASEVDKSVVRYDYSYGVPGGGMINGTTGDTSLTVTVDNLENGTEYNFLVWAVNRAGDGPWAALRATPATVPGALRNLSATAGDSFVALNWDEPESNGGASITGQEFRYAAGSSIPADAAWNDVDSKPAVFFGLANGTKYTFEFRAKNDRGAGDSVSVTATPGRLPGAPENLTATPHVRQVTLRWEKPADDGGATITDYQYRYAEGYSIPDEFSWISAGTTPTVTVDNLTEDRPYIFHLRAVNGVGNGPVAAATATPGRMADAPQTLAAAAGNRQVTLTWEAPADDGGAAISSYEYRYAAGASVPAGTGWTSVGTALTATVNSLDNGTTYAFEVRAVSGFGNGATATATATPATLPEAPQILTAAAGDGWVMLKWEAPSSDGGAPILRYEYRFAAGATVPAGTGWISAKESPTVAVSGLGNGTSYAFEVRAVNAIGNGAAAVVNATPATVPDAPQNLKAAIGDGTAILTWQAPASEGGSALLRYEYRTSTVTRRALCRPGRRNTATAGSALPTEVTLKCAVCTVPLR